MAAENIFDSQKVRTAELIIPPNILKQKVGSGGIAPDVIAKAQESLDNNTVDFRPIATGLLDQLSVAVASAAKLPVTDLEKAVELVIYPAMQLKAQGSMFHFPLITDISDILVNFLETITTFDKDVQDLIIAHKQAITVVIAANMGGPVGPKGKELKDSLMAACERYYKTRGKG